MPGLARALRKRNPKNHPKPEPVLDWHTKPITTVFTGADSPPHVLVGLVCSAEDFFRYRDEVSRATLARLRTADDRFALDLFGPRGPVGRLLTDLGGGDTLGVLAAALHAGDYAEFSLTLSSPLASGLELDVTLPIGIDRITLEEFHGPHVELGEGEFHTLTISMHDATIYVHRFETKEESIAQLERNLESNEPFTDAGLN